MTIWPTKKLYLSKFPEDKESAIEKLRKLPSVVVKPLVL